MEVSIKYDDMDNEIYQISKTQLVIKDEQFKLYQFINGSYEFQKDVLKKDYKKIKKKNRKKVHYLVEFDRKDKIVIKLVHRDNLEKEEKIQQAAEDKYLLKLKKEEEKRKTIEDAKVDLKKNIRILNQTLEDIDLYAISLEEIEKYNLYLLNIIKKVEKKDIKDISTTKQINKNIKISMYKNNIHNYVLENKFFSINQMCKDLDINRKSFYNYKLNEYLKEILIDEENKE